MLAFCLLQTTSPLRASHVLAGGISYQYIGNQTGILGQYKIRLTLVRDITGIGLGTSQNIQVSTPGCVAPQFITVSLVAPEYVDTTSGLYDCVPGMSSVVASRVNVFEGTIVLPLYCPRIKLYWASCCRSPNVNGLVTPNTTGFSFEAEIFTSTSNYGNSSPQFVGPGLAYVCSGNSVWIPQSAVDSDGDSLQYELVPARTDVPLGASVTYAAGRSYLQPLTTTPQGPLILDSQTGMLRFAAQGAQAVPIAIKVTDYRWDPIRQEWLKMGTVMREVFTQVVTTCSPYASSIQIDPTRLGWGVNAQGQALLNAPCGDTLIAIPFVNKLLSANLSTQDLRLSTDQGALVPIKRVQMNAATGRTDTVNLVLRQPLVEGNYHLTVGLFDATPAATYCNVVANLDTLGVVAVQNCAPPAQIACPGMPACDTAVTLQGPHTYYSTWSDTALGYAPPHQSKWTVDQGYFTTPSNRDTVTVFYTASTATLVLETTFSTCVEYDTLQIDNYFGAPEWRRPKLEVRPNPANDEVWVMGVSPGCEVLMVNALGQPVLYHRVASGSSVQLSIAHLPKGSYWLRAISPEATLQTPLVKL